MSAVPVPEGLSAAQLALLVKRLRGESPQSELLWSAPIAVVGIGCRFAGGVESPQQFWRLLEIGVDTITEPPVGRWLARDWFDPDPQAAGKTNSRWGSFVDGVDLFDPAFFGIAPREAASMDPQQRLLLEVIWEGLWDAGIAPDAVAGHHVGVFVAAYGADYGRMLMADPGSIGPHTLAGASPSITSGRVSFLLDLLGPSVSVDSACSSSLVATHLACQSLRFGECNIALAGGVTLHLAPEHYIAMAKLGMLSPDGRCRTFDAGANGFVPGEGCGIVVLKRLVDALADGDRIHAIIRGSATNQDGRTTVLTAPNGLAQRAVVRAALANARVAPSQLTYVETHGTGTALGDPIEVEALAEVLGQGSEACVLGAVKTNVGHLEAAAGIAGLIKAVLSLEHEAIPANLHYERLNPHISLEGTRLAIPTATTPWPRGQTGRFAGVSSFGFGGTNAHVIVEEAPRVPPPPVVEAPMPLLLPVSARDPQALTALARAYRDFLGRADVPLADVCRAAAIRRTHYEERIGVVGSTAAEFCEGLDALIEGGTRAGASRSRATENADVVFVFTGQGSQWPRMGAGLLAAHPVFRVAMEECDSLIKQHAHWSLLEQIDADSADCRLDRTEFAQPAIFAIEIALARLWMSWGVLPAVVIGHSAGEVAAAHVAGVLDLDEAIRIIVQRGKIMDRATGQGRMAAVLLPVAEVRPDIAGFGRRLAIAATNSPVSTVVSGDSDAIDEVVAGWRRRGVECRPLPVDYAFHSRQMEPFADELTRTLEGVASRTAAIPMLSTVTGRAVDGSELGAEYWGRNVRERVSFDAAVAAAIATGFRTFLEVGPHPALSPAVSECLAAAGVDGAAVASLRRNLPERQTLLASLGALYTRGVAVVWRRVYPGRAPVIDLPRYPFQRQRYWINPTAAAGSSRRGFLRPLLQRRVRSPLHAGAVFESELSLETFPYLGDHRIGGTPVIPMTAFLEMIVEAVSETQGADAVVLEDLVVQRPLALPEEGSCTIQVVLDAGGVRVFSRDGDSWSLHTTGRYSSPDVVAARHYASVDATASVAGAESVCDVGEHYRRAAARGANFGAAFRTVTSLRASNGSASCDVRLGAPQAVDASRYRVHPALLDGCVQSVLAAAGDDDGPTWIPMAIDRFESMRSAGTAVRGRLELIDREGAGEALAANLQVDDTEGCPVAIMRGLRFARFRPPAVDLAAQFTYRINWRAEPRSGGAVRARRSGSWLIIADETGLAEEMRSAFERRGDVCDVVEPGGEPTGEQIAACRGIVHLGAIEAPRDVLTDADLDRTFARGCGSVMRLVKSSVALGSSAPELWLITRDAMTVRAGDAVEGFVQAGVLGLARTIAMEHPELRCATIDVGGASDAPAIVDEIRGADAEDRVALREGVRWVPRLEPAVAPVSSGAARRLVVATRGSLEDLQFEPLDRTAPGANQIEIRVEAAALNLRDVLNTLGLYPGEAGPLGLEFCGRIASVGAGVTRWTPGDRVMGIAWGSFADYVVASADLVTAVPQELDAESAATMPNAFVTAHHCLMETARLRAGERVLIHAGAGGVGMAAVQLALDAGAEVFATAGSEEKRAHLRGMGVAHVTDSRMTAFAAQILADTGGRGVDVVLNSLAGEMIGATFSVIAHGGRFVEIGKRDVWSPAHVAALGKDVAYSVVDLGPIVDADPARLGRELDHIRELVVAGRIRPLPHRVFEFGEAAAAFRYMAQARHTGRVVLRIGARAPVRSDATYLITGGTGAIGLCMAAWLAEQGAKHLVLVGRSAPSAGAVECVAELDREGVQVVVRRADVADRAQVASVLAEIAASMPILRGVVHAAGVVDDGVLVNQTWERAQRVLAPKVHGAWHLHELTAGTAALDFFVLCSSVASVIGSPAQGAYAAGNAFLDALAARRAACGLPALSVNWGAWADSGMAARVSARGGRRVLDAIRPMSPSDCLACLRVALLGADTQLVIADAAWTSWSGVAPSILSALVRVPVPADAAPANDRIARRLEQAPEGSRRGVLIDFIRQESRRVLGLASSHPIDERQTLLSLGLDSLMAVELRNRLALALERALPATLLFDYPTLGGLAQHLVGAQPGGSAPREDALLREIATMSDADAEALLESELGRG